MISLLSTSKSIPLNQSLWAKMKLSTWTKWDMVKAAGNSFTWTFFGLTKNELFLKGWRSPSDGARVKGNRPYVLQFQIWVTCLYTQFTTQYREETEKWWMDEWMPNPAKVDDDCGWIKSHIKGFQFASCMFQQRATLNWLDKQIVSRRERS